MEALLSLVRQVTDVTLAAVLRLAVLATVFSLLALCVTACNKAPPWWRKPDLLTDLCWAVVPQFLYRYVTTLMLVLGMAVFYGMTGLDEMSGFFNEGHGPLAHLGFWPQVALYLLGSDFVLYTTHRMFHTARLWRFHAVHHSSEHLEWTSASRFHPVDQILHGIMSDIVMLLLGIPPEVMVWLMPFNVGTSALVHANLDWDFGPFRYVLASPVFHRWHHTSADRGGSSNFAGTFPLYDLVFGTFHMPAGQRPDTYGVDDPHFPSGFLRQLRYPLRPRRRNTPEGRDAETRGAVAQQAFTRPT